MPKTALLLIAHGSRYETANDDLRALALSLRSRAEFQCVQASFLELAQPSIAEGGQLCVEQGADRVLLLPYFLSAGLHVQRDLSASCSALSERYPHVRFILAEPLGRHPLLEEIVLCRVKEVENR